eukprot:SM000291S10874  [mRNA]  locus=s291:87177:90341:- [translate_table: standard]
MGYLRRILTSRVYDVAMESPLELAPKLSERVRARVLLKREDMQQVFSFKLRGAYNMMAQLPPEQLARGVICSSAGNHAQGVALSARVLGCSAVVAMPVTTPEIKWLSVERLGATVVLVGDSYDETQASFSWCPTIHYQIGIHCACADVAGLTFRKTLLCPSDPVLHSPMRRHSWVAAVAQAYAMRRGEEEGRVFIPPFDHPDVIAGQGTVGLEIVRQHPGPLHAIFVPVGGGGLIAGIAAYVKRLRPEVRIIGVEPVDANAMALSLHHRRRVQLEQVGGFADGVAVKMVGKETFRLCQELLDGVVLVGRDAICSSIKDVFEETRSILEPAGALALAGAKAYCTYYGLEGESVVAITSGANMNFDRLRLITELANVGARREAVLATSMPETPGSFKTFASMVGPKLSITEFKYRYADDSVAHVLYRIIFAIWQALACIEPAQKGSPYSPMIDRDVPNEILYRFVFPEKPGALAKFLRMLSPRWNITLFHYRSQGEMGANCLVGLQVPANEARDFELSANALGYEYENESGNEAFHMFMR